MMYWKYIFFAAIEAYWKFLMKVVFVCVCILYTVYLFIWINGFNIEIKCMFRRFLYFYALCLDHVVVS